jgi:hypothetical protein
MLTSIKASPRERYAAGEVLQRILNALEPTGSERDTRVRREVAQAAKALQRGRDPFDQQHRRGRGI